MHSQNYEKGNTSHSDESDHDPQNKMGVSVDLLVDGQNEDQRTPQYHRGGDSGSATSSSKRDQMIRMSSMLCNMRKQHCKGRTTGLYLEGKSMQMRNDKNDGEPSSGYIILPVGAEGRRPYVMNNAAWPLFENQEIGMTSS